MYFLGTRKFIFSFLNHNYNSTTYRSLFAIVVDNRWSTYLSGHLITSSIINNNCQERTVTVEISFYFREPSSDKLAILLLPIGDIDSRCWVVRDLWAVNKWKPCLMQLVIRSCLRRWRWQIFARPSWVPWSTSNTHMQPQFSVYLTYITFNCL